MPAIAHLTCWHHRPLARIIYPGPPPTCQRSWPSLLAGAADGTLRVWDRRKTATPAFAFHHHSQAVTVVEWCPQQAGVFSSAGEDRWGAESEERG